MKKFIYAIVLLACVQFVQAQSVIATLFVSGGSYYYLDSITLTVPPAPDDELSLPLAIYCINDGTEPINIGDSVYVRFVLNEETPHMLILTALAKIDVDSLFRFECYYPFLSSHLKAGDYANTLCIDIASITYSGVSTPISEDPDCSVITFTGLNVDIANVNNLQEVNIFPNPVQGNNLKIENLSEATDIHLYSITGQLIQKETAVMGNTYMDVSNLSNGMYILKMQSGKNFRTEKVQIVR
jgi:hypothetical protein